MRKITLLLAICFSALILKAHIHVAGPTPISTTIWQKSVAGATLPSWFLTTTSKTRLIGASNEHVFVPTREIDGGKTVFIYNRATGEDIGELNTTDLVGGTFVVSDVGVTDDGKIIVCNLAVDGNFKLYMYENISSAPTVILDVPTATQGGRTGDVMTVIGDYSKGTAKIYTATAKEGSEIYVLEMENGVWKTEREYLATITGKGITGGGNASVAPKPDGEIYWNASGQSFKRMKADKTIDELGAGFSPYSSSMKYLGYSESYGLDYFAIYTYTANKECAEIISMEPGNLYTCLIIGRTANLGGNANVGGTGDVEVRYDENYNPMLYVLSTNNGFGAYKIEGLDIQRPIIGSTPTTINNKLLVYPNPATDRIILSETANSVKIFNITGQLVKEVCFTNTVDVLDLQGLYIIDIETINGKATKRINVQ